MNQRTPKKINLLRLVLGIALATGVLTFGNVFHASYQVQRTHLINVTLESNFNYAQKLASSTQDFLLAAQKQIAMAAQWVAPFYSDQEALQVAGERLRLQTQSFNSVIFLNQEGVVLATSPESLNIVGQIAQMEDVQKALRSPGPFVSAPIVSITNTLIIFIAHPVVSSDGEHLGLVGGTLYLQQPSILNRLLGNHYYTDGSHLYVVTQDKQLIYHPHQDRIGKIVEEDNAIMEAIASGQGGKQLQKNDQDQSMLAGYAIVPATGWAIVAQSPLEVAIAPLESLMQQVIYKIMPLTVIILLLIWWGAKKIVRPLHSLADNAREMSSSHAVQNIQKVPSWYYESYELKNALLLGMVFFQRSIERLKHDVKTDPLTGLYNRRGLDDKLDDYQAKQIPFAVIAMDIDHFKRVNDTYGHDAGDRVLKVLAQLMQEHAQASDLCCRIGGEEFLLVQPQKNVQAALQVAENLRSSIEATPMPYGGYITASFGVACWPLGDKEVAAVLKKADVMLYEAKKEGGNCVKVYALNEYSYS